VTLPGSLTRIPEGLFKFAGLETVYFEKGVEVIGEYAFYQCRNLTAFYAYNTLTTIEDCAFDGCEQLWNVYFYGTYEQWLEVEIGANMWMLEMFATITCLDPDACTHKNVTIVPGQAPTCTQEGLTDGKACADCGQILEEQEKLDALGHDWSNWEETVAPTEETCGREERSCYRCGETESRETDPLEHTHRYEQTEVSEPNCTEPGYIRYTCHCGDSYTEELPATGHHFEDGSCTDCGAPVAMMGDLNGDGRINARDARLLLRLIAGLTEEGEVNETVADFNGDGRVNARDARAILRFIAGLD
jgi:hypothetical protein